MPNYLPRERWEPDPACRRSRRQNAVVTRMATTSGSQDLDSSAAYVATVRVPSTLLRQPKLLH
ncbi:MAG: hypothetical protein LC777_00430 [Actinobacteria bacterium]|nr:hypothetical protein [Actinomycetota bacterium]